MRRRHAGRKYHILCMWCTHLRHIFYRPRENILLFMASRDIFNWRPLYLTVFDHFFPNYAFVYMYKCKKKRLSGQFIALLKSMRTSVETVVWTPQWGENLSLSCRDKWWGSPSHQAAAGGCEECWCSLGWVPRKEQQTVCKREKRKRQTKTSFRWEQTSRAMARFLERPRKQNKSCLHSCRRRLETAPSRLKTRLLPHLDKTMSSEAVTTPCPHVIMNKLTAECSFIFKTLCSRGLQIA